MRSFVMEESSRNFVFWIFLTINKNILVVYKFSVNYDLSRFRAHTNWR